MVYNTYVYLRVDNFWHGRNVYVMFSPSLRQMIHSSRKVDLALTHNDNLRSVSVVRKWCICNQNIYIYIYTKVIRANTSKLCPYGFRTRLINVSLECTNLIGKYSQTNNKYSSLQWYWFIAYRLVECKSLYSLALEHSYQYKTYKQNHSATGYVFNNFTKNCSYYIYY